MIRLAILLMFTVGLSISVLAEVPIDSTAELRFQKLADELRLRKPKLKGSEYEIRIWNKQGLMFGTAQMLYVLTKKKRSATAFKYIIHSDKGGFKYAVKLKPTVPVTPELWGRLLQYDLLILPDQIAIQTKLHPCPQKDLSWISVEADGSVSVHAKRTTVRNVVVSDGESYYVEVFDIDGYRGYGYNNPRIYHEYKPDIVELRKMVAILNELADLFR